MEAGMRQLVLERRGEERRGEERRGETSKRRVSHFMTDLHGDVPIARRDENSSRLGRVKSALSHGPSCAAALLFILNSFTVP
jgi:hypothetical protein